MMCRGVVVAVLLSGPGPAYADTVHVHSSGRFDRPASTLHLEAARYARTAGVVTWTEVDAPARTRALRVPGWGVAVPDRSDVGVSWDRDLFHLEGTSRRRLGSGWPTPYAAAVALEGSGRPAVFVVAHLPSSVEHGDTFTTPAQARTWTRAVRALRSYAGDVHRRWAGVLVIAADWNVDLRRPVWRHRLEDVFPRMRLTWARPYPRSGTLGRRLIDATLTGAGGRARLLPDDNASDHRPYTERLEW